MRTKREIAIFDSPGAYLQAEMPKEKNLLMKFRNEFVHIMCEVNPEYKKYVVKENEKDVDLWLHMISIAVV